MEPNLLNISISLLDMSIKTTFNYNSDFTFLNIEKKNVGRISLSQKKKKEKKNCKAYITSRSKIPSGPTSFR